MFVECYDVGGTYLRAALVKDRKILGTVHRERTQRDFCLQIEEISSRFQMNFTSPIPPLSIVVPGPVKEGILVSAPPLNLHEPTYIQERFNKNSRSVLVNNDVDAALEAELQYGAGQKYSSLYLLSLSTGIGAALAIEGKRVRGLSCEFGHNVLARESGFICGCGHYGCWASFSSGMGLRNFSKRYLGEEIEAKDILLLSKRGNTQAQRIVEEVRGYNAQGMGAMINVCPVDAIVLMGSLGLQAFDDLVPSFQELRKYTLHKEEIPIFPSSLGDTIGILGAYAIVPSSLSS